MDNARQQEPISVEPCEREGEHPAESLVARAAPVDLFPLDLTPFEQYMLLDDHPHHPLTVFVQLVFSTPLSEPELEVALQQATARNPLFACRVVRSGNVWQWHHDAELRQRLCSMEQTPPVADNRIQPFDLAQEVGVRVWHHQQKDGLWRLLFQFHHACADGIGMRRYVIDVITCYSRQLVDRSNPLHTSLRLDRLDHERLRQRGEYQHLIETSPAIKLSSWQKLKNNYYFFLQPPEALRGDRNVKPGNSVATTQQMGPATATSRSLQNLEANQLPALVNVLDNRVSDAILEAARRDELSLNDLGLALLFRHIATWQETHGVRGSRRRIRILMPFDIRVKEDLRLSAANRLSFAFLGRTHRQCRDWNELLHSVQRETQHIKDSRVYTDFLFGLALCQKHPRLFALVLKRMQRAATAVLTYAGDMNRGLNRVFPTDQGGRSRVGPHWLENCSVTPPVRNQTNIGIGICLSAGRLSFSATWNRAVFSTEHAQRFFDQYVDSWYDWADAGGRLR